MEQLDEGEQYDQKELPTEISSTGQLSHRRQQSDKDTVATTEQLVKPSQYQKMALHPNLVWSDPDEKNGWVISLRGSGVLSGPDIAKEFNLKNKY